MSQPDLQYYPTPDSLAREMARQLPTRCHIIVEPSAGDGALVRAVRKYLELHNPNTHRNTRIYACEIDEGRRAKLDVPVIGHDYLASDVASYRPDCIIMNPPFCNARAHFNKACRDLAPGGRLVALMPTGGDHVCYEDGEMTIGVSRGNRDFPHLRVDVSIVTFNKAKGAVENDDLWSSLNEEAARVHSGGSAKEGLMIRPSEIELMVAQYNQAMGSYAAVAKAHRAIEFYTPFSLKTVPPVDAFAAVADELREGFWDKVFVETKINRYMTGKMADEFRDFQRTQGRREFTVASIVGLLGGLIADSERIAKRAALQAFEMLTKYHKANRCHHEGWVSNSDYMMARKVVIPYYLDSYGYVSYDRERDVQDLEKAICMMEGLDYEQLQRNAVADENEGLSEYLSRSHHGSLVRLSFPNSLDPDGEWRRSHFFDARVYKKGTIHLRWRDEALWARFNCFACDGEMTLGRGK